MEENVNYKISETNQDVNVEYNEILNLVNDMDSNKLYEEDEDYSGEYAAYIYEYDCNYTKKELDKIADYYEITKRKKRKMELIEDIVLFELDEHNDEIVNKRKLMWFYFEQLKNDKYLKKFLILD